MPPLAGGLRRDREGFEVEGGSDRWCGAGEGGARRSKAEGVDFAKHVPFPLPLRLQPKPLLHEGSGLCLPPIPVGGHKLVAEIQFFN